MCEVQGYTIMCITSKNNETISNSQRDITVKHKDNEMVGNVTKVKIQTIISL